MGKKKYDVEGLFRKSPVVSASSIERIVGSRNYAKQLIRKLALQGNIKKLAKGCYTSFNDASLAVFCLKPAYLGLQDALSFHNLWEQETIPIIITSQKVRPGVRNVLGANVLVRRIETKYLFGFDYCNEGQIYLPYSSIEKTFIDMVYFRQKISKELLNSFRKRLDRKKLRALLSRYPKLIRKKVMEMTD
jgi:predicted transcriptional regulator of viral defense system